MAEIDGKRKFIIVAVMIGGISLMAASRPSQGDKAMPAVAAAAAPAQAPVPTPAITPAVESTPAEPVAAVVEPKKAEPAVQQAQTMPFIVYKDKPSANHYVLSGYMPDGQCVQMNDAWVEHCKEGRSCIKASYDTACSQQSQGWAGVYWLDPANNWGDQKGGYNLSRAQKLVFWAKGEKGGEMIATFKIGGTGVNHDFPDTDTAGIGPVMLTSSWQEYSIDLQGKDLSRIIGGFAWVANTKDNNEPITFYLDDVHFE
jgi:hypothetical protein